MADPAPLTAEELAVHVGWSPRGLNGLEVQRLERILATARAAQARAEAAEARLAALKAGGWVRCADRLPEHRGWVQTWGPSQAVLPRSFDGTDFRLGGFYEEQGAITHWRPLADPPAPTADPQPEADA